MKKKKQNYVHRVIVKHYPMMSVVTPHNVLQPICLLRKSSNISRMGSRPAVGAVGSVQSQIWPCSACTCSQSPQLPPVSTVSGSLQGFLGCTSGCRSDFPSSSSVTLPLMLCFSFGSTSACRLPSGICSLPRQNGVKAETYQGSLAPVRLGEGGLW